MKKIGLLIILIPLLSFLVVKTFALPHETRINGDIFSCSSPLGPALCCDPSDNLCIICYCEYTFEQQPIQNHIGMFIPSQSDPETGEGYTDVNVKEIILSSGAKQYQYQINPNNIIIRNYPEWLKYMQNHISR